MPSKKIGRYEVVAPLAEGGMGEVALAREVGPAGFERLVVVKTIHEQVANNREFVDAFLREARLVARLNHPNIVQIIELGQVGEDEYFIAMEYIEGSSVDELLLLAEDRGERVPLEVVVSIGIQACRGLEVAHDLRAPDGTALGLVHRDVSPQNLMCTTRGFVKVLDFGIAKTTKGLETTESGALKGKPGYFSPEQARAQPLDPRTDIFSLGAVLWELASGKPLFQQGGAFGTLLAVIDAPIPLLTDLGIDHRFDAIVRRALARDREQRFQTAAELRLALSEFAASQQWDDVHDSLAAYVSAAAGDVLEARHDAATAARVRPLTAAEGRNLAKLTPPPQLPAGAKTLDVGAEKTRKLTEERLAATVSSDLLDTIRSPAVPDADELPSAPQSAPLPLSAVLARNLVLMTTAFLVVAAATVLSWLQPTWVPGVVFLAMVVLPMALWGALSGPLEHRPRRTISVAVPAFFLLVACFSWTAPAVRGAAARWVAANGWETQTSRALFDKSSRVVGAVCEGLKRSKASLPQRLVAEKLSSINPDSAACLVDFLDPDAPSTHVTVDYLVPRWTKELRTADERHDRDALCEKANWTARAIKRTRREGDLSLLDCSLRADLPSARACCAQGYRSLALGQGGTANGLSLSLPPARSAIENGGLEITEFLVALWTGRRDLDPALRQSLELDSDAMRTWAMAVQCENLVAPGSGADTDASLSHLRALVGSECRLPDEVEQEQAIWASSCQAFFEQRRFWEASPDDPRVLCDEVTTRLSSVSLLTARELVAEAWREAMRTDAPGRGRARRAEIHDQCLEGRDAGLCRELGSYHQRLKEFELAYQFFKAGCEAGDKLACNSAGYVLSIEYPRDAPEKKLAFGYYERACRLGNLTGCSNVADELKDGDYVPRDLKRARQIYLENCDKREGYSCAGLATMYWDGVGVAQSSDKALLYWKRACAADFRHGCLDLALDARSLPKRPKDIPAESALLDKGCRILDKALCVRSLAARYISGRGVQDDVKRAKRHLAWACELGNEESCRD